MSAATETVETVETTTAIGKKKGVEKTGNLILDVATEIENLTKVKAIHMAEHLAEDIEVNYFKLGGVLQRIKENSWFEGFDSFDSMVFERYGFQGRKAAYLIAIYDNLVKKQIPWEKVSGLGWTKLKDLAPVLTPENVDEWVAKAAAVTVLELQALLKAAQPSEEGESTVKTSDEVVKVNFKFKKEQAEYVQQAIAKAKGELHTEYDTVAMENIALAYLGDNVKIKSLDQIIKETGFEGILTRTAELFPEYDITVVKAKAKTDADAPATE